MYNSMVYTDATRRATLNYRRKNADKLRIVNCKYTQVSRTKWASFHAETKALRAIDYS